MSNPAIFHCNSASAAPRPIVVLGFCLGVMSAACTFDASRLRAPRAQPQDAAELAFDAGDAGQRDLGGDAGNSSDLAISADVHWVGDRPPARDLTGATGDDTREAEPDSAGAVGLPDGDGQGDAYQVEDDAPAADRFDARLSDGGGTDQRPDQAVDAPADVARSWDGVVTDGMDAEAVGGDVPGSETAEAGGIDWDAQTNTPDTGTVAADSAADTAPPIDPDLVLWYPFDETSGTIAHDSAQFGGVARNATLMTAGLGGSASFSTDKQVGTRALALVPASPASNGGGYVVLPTFDTLAPDAITIAVWVKLAVAGSAQAWERIYDFGDSTTAPRWFNLAARNGGIPAGPIFNMSNTGHATADQQKLTGPTALRANTWYHIAVVLPAGTPFTGVMYIDGVVADTNSAMTVHLSDIGATARNWIGRSQFTDPYFNGSIDDFRVYRRALSQQEIVALMAIR